MIHPLAIVDPSAEVGDGVEIGPWTTVGPGVVIGPGCVIASHVVLKGPTVIGKNNKVSTSIESKIDHKANESSISCTRRQMICFVPVW